MNVRLGGETDQQNVIMHKAYFKRHFELTFEKNAYLFDTFFVIILIVGFHILASVLGSILEQFQEKALEVPIYYYHYYYYYYYYGNGNNGYGYCHGNTSGNDNGSGKW